MKIRSMAVLALVAVGLSLALSVSAAPGRKFRIGFSQSTMNNPWRIAMIESAKDEAKKNPEIQLLIADGQDNNAKQISDVQNFIAQKVDCLIISPREARPLTKVVREAYQAGIPVIVLDREIVGNTYTAFIGASNLEIGNAAGEYIAKALKGKGSIVEIEGILGATPTIQRSEGMHQAIAKAKGIRIVVKQNADYLRAPAISIMQNALLSQKKIDCVYAHNDEMALGAYKAAKDAGREKGVLFVGIDGQREAIKSIMDGKMSATFIYPFCGKEAIQTAVKIMHKQKVPKLIRLKTQMITRDNAKKNYSPKSYF